MSNMYKPIASKIFDVRLLTDKGGFELPNDEDILMDFEELAIFVIENFEIPITHIEYACESLGINSVNSSIEIINEIKRKNKSIIDSFEMDRPLRAIEICFSVGNQKEKEIKVLIKLNFLIAKLHSSIGKKYFL